MTPGNLVNSEFRKDIQIERVGVGIKKDCIIITLLCRENNEKNILLKFGKTKRKQLGAIQFNGVHSNHRCYRLNFEHT